jgi:hypothetical protein
MQFSAIHFPTRSGPFQKRRINTQQGRDADTRRAAFQINTFHVFCIRKKNKPGGVINKGEWF